METEMKLKDYSPETGELEIVGWNVKAGERFCADQVLLEVLADKASIEIVLRRPGQICSILADAGAIVDADETIAILAFD